MQTVVLKMPDGNELTITMGAIDAIDMMKKEEDTPVPDKPIQPIPAKPPARLSPCQKAIWATVARASGPMTAEQIMGALGDKYNYSDSAIQKALAGLTRDGLLRADPHGKPPGYRILIDDAGDGQDAE